MRASRSSSLAVLIAAAALPAAAAFVTPEGFEQYSAFKDIRWMPKKVEAVRGDTLMVSFRARGRGRAVLKLFLYDGQDSFRGGNSNKAMVLSDGWRRFDHRIVVTDNDRPTERVAIAFGAPPGGADFEVSDFSYELVKTSARGLVGGGAKASYTLVPGKDGWRPLEFKVDVPESFDPVARKWPLVFSDEFDGRTVDVKKWTNDPPSVPVAPNESLRLDGKGHLEILCDVGKDGRLRTGGMWSVRDFLWGYYETRVKFTRQPGWWAAFMLYATSDTNPLLDGYEVDVFEDLYTRGRDKAGNGSRKYSVTVHSIANKVLKSFDYTGEYADTPGDWHVVGCLRTPFALAVYVDGRLVKTQESHGPYAGAVFDPFNHAACTVPLHLILTGALADAARKDEATRKAAFPEAFCVDYVRAYEMPPCDLSVGWRNPGRAAVVRPGETLAFDLAVAGAKGGVRGAYLFDNGNLVAVREKAPWRFELPFTEEAYSSTRYLEPARTGVKAELVNGCAHVFAAAVQDERGRVAFTDSLVRLPPQTEPPDGPVEVPGTFTPKGLVEMNGAKTAHVRLSVPRAGTYELVFDYGTTTRVRNRLLVAVDGEWAAAVDLPMKDLRGDAHLPAAVRLKLPKGRPVLSFHLIGRAAFSAFRMTAKGNGR